MGYRKSKIFEKKNYKIGTGSKMGRWSGKGSITEIFGEKFSKKKFFAVISNQENWK